MGIETKLKTETNESVNERPFKTFSELFSNALRKADTYARILLRCYSKEGAYQMMKNMIYAWTCQDVASFQAMYYLNSLPYIIDTFSLQDAGSYNFRILDPDETDLYITVFSLELVLWMSQINPDDCQELIRFMNEGWEAL